jgi:acetyl esterase
VTKLNPQAQALLDAGAASGLPPVYTIPIDEARTRMRASFIKGDVPAIAIQDLTIAGPGGGIPIRLYHPAPGTKVPVLLFFHGGGWTVNDLDTHDRLCSLLANTSQVAIVAVDYRRGPEHKYPAPVEDGYTALIWLTENATRLGVDPLTIAVGGDSSGATIATALCLLATHRRGPRIALQLLFYPVTDYLEPVTNSYVERGTGYSLNKAFMEWSWANYLPDEWDRDDPYLFPLRAPNLSQLPRTLILTAEFDPLRDEGIAYAERLQAAHIPTTHWHLDDQMHGFAMQTASIGRAAEVVAEVSEALSGALYQRQKEMWVK